MTDFSFDSFNIEAFKATLSKLGYQRSDRYIFQFGNTGFGPGLETALAAIPMQMREFSEHLNRRMIKVSIPQQTLQSNAVVSSGIDFENPYKMGFEGDLEFTFINDKEGHLVKIFHTWMDDTFNPLSGHFEYKEDYACDAVIFAADTKGDISHSYSITEMFPKTYSVSDFSTETSLQEVTVTMSYKYFSVDIFRG